MKILQFFLIFGLSVGVFAGGEFENGKVSFQQGKFAQDLIDLYEKRKSISKEEKVEEYINVSLHLATAYQNLGRMWEAYGVLNDTLDLYKGEEPLLIRAKVFIQLSDFYVEMRNFNKNRGSCEIKNTIENVIGDKELEVAPEAMLNSALDYLNKALENLLETDSFLKAKILNRKGNVLFLQSKLEEFSNKSIKLKEALEAYEDALNNLPSNDKQAETLRVKIKLNLFDSGKEKSKQNLYELSKLIAELSNSHDKNFALINLAKLSDNNEDKLLYLNKVVKLAGEQNDKSSEIHALFELAKLYEQHKLHKDAISLLRKAIFHASNSDMLSERLDILYRLEWKLSKFLKNNNNSYYTVNSKDHMQVIEDTYKIATTHMKELEQGYTVLPDNFYNDKEELFMEYADVLLKKAYRMLDVTEEQKAKKQDALKHAIEVIESSKVAKVKDYLEDSCITKELEEQKNYLYDNLPKNTAIFYPLLFDDRIESLIIADGKIYQYVNFYNQEKNLSKIVKTINRINHFIHSESNKNLLKKNIRKLSNWFNHVFNAFNGKKIITIVPSGQTYKIPFSALYYDKDTEDYLINKYALVITPSIKLTNNELSVFNNNLLLAGTSIFPQKENLPELCHTVDELVSSSCIFNKQRNTIDNNILSKSYCLKQIKENCNCLKKKSKDYNSNNIINSYSKLEQCLRKDKYGTEIKACMSNIKVLLEKDFTVNNLKEYISKNNYSSIHISTHGIFSENHKKTILYTSDSNNITIPKLRNIFLLSNKKPNIANLNLLILSACESAKGDNKAQTAFGFTSIAVSSGVNSVLGTLWRVDEEFTMQLMNDFYKNYYNSKLNKAISLQKAIKANMKKYPYPYYWAAFVLVGKSF